MKRPLTRFVVGSLTLVACVGAGFWLAGALGQSGAKETLPAAPADRPGTAVMVTTAPVAYRTIQRTVEAVGTLYGYEEVSISNEVEGRVAKMYHDVSDRVKPGDVLLELDPRDYELAVRQAEKTLQVELAKLGLTAPPGPSFDISKVPTVVQAGAKLEQAMSQLDRTQAAYKEGAGSAEDLQQKRTDLKVAQAEYENQLLLARAGMATVEVKQEALAIAQEQLSDTKVRVPTPTMGLPGDGPPVEYAVTLRATAEGTFVRPATEVFKLVIDRTLKLKAPVPERFVGEVEVGQTADVTTAADPRPVAGTVTRINPAVNPDTRTFEVEIQIANTGRTLKPGSFAKAAILTRVDAAAPTVSVVAPTTFAGVTKLFLLEAGHAKEVRVTLGLQGPDWVEVVSPVLPEGVPVVVSGQTVIADGTPLVVRDSREAGR